LAKHLRTADLKDIKAAGLDPLDSLMRGYVYSRDCMTICLPDGTPAAMFGMAPFMDGDTRCGSIWLLGTEQLVSYKWKFLRESRGWLSRLSQGVDLLCNVVHRENTEHIKWIRWLGFSFIRRTEMNGEPVIEFAKIINNV